MVHDQLQSGKVGIANAGSGRIAKHIRHGWSLVRTFDQATGRDALRIEQATLRWLREDQQAPIALTPADMPQSGWTETFALHVVTSADVVAQIEQAMVAPV